MNLPTLDEKTFIDLPAPEPYTLNPVVADMVGPELAEEYTRLLSVWRDNGWACRDVIAQAFDKRADFAAIRDIGPVRAPYMAELMSLPYGQDIDGKPSFNFFTAVCGLSVHCDEVVQTDQV